MYRISDKTSAIIKVQEYLKKIYIDEITIIPSGIYDDKTRRLIMKFQEENDINVSGIVDEKTFSWLYNTYSKVIKDEETRRNNPFINFPLRKGMLDQSMSHIHYVIGQLLDYYGKQNNVRYGNYFSDNTVAGVKILKEIYLFLNNDIIDEQFYRMMINDLNSIKSN